MRTGQAIRQVRGDRHARSQTFTVHRTRSANYWMMWERKEEERQGGREREGDKPRGRLGVKRRARAGEEGRPAWGDGRGTTQARGRQRLQGRHLCEKNI